MTDELRSRDPAHSRSSRALVPPGVRRRSKPAG